MVHVLKFNAIYKERIWGGRRLESLFGRALPGSAAIGESWDLADLPDDKSVVAEGPAAGKRLDQLVQEWGTQLLGKSKLDGGQFPLLVKMLDANDVLSVQVHPDYKAASAMGLPARAKYEAWYVVHAEPGGFVYRGFRHNVTQADVEHAIAAGTLAELMIRLPAKAGDWFYLPGGVCHAIGTGLVIAEVQTPSDTTFRLYDWGRVDPNTHRPRDLHIEKALQCLDLTKPNPDGPGYVGACSETASERLVSAPTFDLSKEYCGPDTTGTFPLTATTAWVILSGSGRIGTPDFETEFEAGQTILAPAALGKVNFATDAECSFLQVVLK
jgi:mannose-6-phosphate isomerase